MGKERLTGCFDVTPTKSVDDVPMFFGDARLVVADNGGKLGNREAEIFDKEGNEVNEHLILGRTKEYGMKVDVKGDGAAVVPLLVRQFIVDAFKFVNLLVGDTCDDEFDRAQFDRGARFAEGVALAGIVVNIDGNLRRDGAWVEVGDKDAAAWLLDY